MPEVTITRKHVIVVDTVGENAYKDMVFKDKEGNDYKISTKRVQYFESKIVAGQAVQLNYAMSSFGKEYIYSAELVAGNLPPPVKPTTIPVPGVEIPRQASQPIVPLPPVPPKAAGTEWDRITRKSIERQTALTDAARVAVAKISAGDKEITTEKILASAKAFETYLETGEAVLPKSSLVKAAEKLGAVETK